MNHILEVDRVTKDFYPPLSNRQFFTLQFRGRKPVRALDDISFSLERGKILGVLGPNGAGKTTLLKIIATLILPNKGSVILNGCRVGADDKKIKSYVGLVLSHERSFYWRLTGRQNLEFFAALYGLNKQETKSRIEELFQLLEVDYQDKRFDFYSSGMQQKFALMRALIHDPELLLLDEPTKGLDYKTSLNLKKFIKEELVQKKGKMALFTTHRMEEAPDFCDQFLILNKGKSYGMGTLEQLRKSMNRPSASFGEIFLKLTERTF
jgi:ABC-2 type transport system ATP-binding protein